MMHPSLDSLLEKVDNRFALCIIAGKRARQLIDGAHKLTNYNSWSEVTIAMNEVSENKITHVSPKYRSR